MPSVEEIIASIKARIQNPDFRVEMTGDILKDCTRAIYNLNRRLKRAKSVAEKSHLTTCLGQVKGWQHMLKDKRVGCGSGVRRAETATHRVKWEDVNSSFDSRIRTGVIINIRHTEVMLFLEDCAALFKRRIRNALKKDEALKVNAVLCGEFQIKKADKVVEELKYLNTRNAAIYRDTDLQTWFKTKITDLLLAELEDFQERDSGWALSRVVNLMVSINKYNPLHAGSYIELPKQIARKEACINVKNTDDMCFAWAVISALYPAPRGLTMRTSSYPDPKTVLNLEGIQFPVTAGQYNRFESQNNLSFNVYRLNKKGKDFQVVPFRITKNKKEKHVNLLLLQDLYITENDLDNLTPPRFHFVWIKSLSRLLSSQLSKHNGKTFICDRCLHYYGTEEKLAGHIMECEKLGNITVPRVPEKDNALVEFKNFNQKEKVPFIIYADTECLLLPMEDDTHKNTQKCQEHVPFSVGYYVKCSYDESLSFYKSYTGSDCMQWFVKELIQFAENLETVFLCPLPMEQLTQEENLNFSIAVHCHICERPFNAEDARVRDHCHFTGKYRGAAHESCNLNFQDTHNIPVVFHNLSGYDGHMMVKAIAEVEGKIDILPINKEKYISFTKHIPGNLIKFRFIDSFRFLASGLDMLASYLDDYPILNSEFKELSGEQFKLLTRKGVFPYDFMDSWDKLSVQNLPPKCAFYNSLDDSFISENSYEHAQKVWSSFGCTNMQQYSELYMKTDILLLADVFEEFRSISLSTYGIDPAHSYTLPGYAWQCLLLLIYRENIINLNLLTDYDMVTFIEQGIRGGLSQCSKRYSEANNKYMPNFDESKPDKYLMYFDVNNQYGWAMSQYLPYGGFEWVDDVANFDVFSVADDSTKGFILEADLEIPHTLHDKFSDLPPCPEHRKPEGSKTTKLLATLNNKEKYIIHYRNLKQAMKLGVKLTKIYRIISFDQAPWLRSYIDLNTRLRQNAKNEFEKNFFKLMNNAVFGKTMENLRKHSDVKIIMKWEGRYGAEALISRPEFKSSTIINENLVIVELAKSEVYFNKPIYVGMCILDLAKTTIYNFHYCYMKNRFPNCKVLYTDTDSLIYEINHNDVYQILIQDCHKYFDTSDYANDNIYNIPRVNKKVLGMLKDENNGRIMTHFAGLRSKMYTVKTLFTPEELEKERLKLEKAAKDRAEIDCALANLGVTKKIKGIKKCVIKNKITFEDYVNCLETWLEKPISQRTIRSTKHDLYSIRQTKIGLSPYDDKRKISKSSPDTLPWGHFTIMEEV